VSGGEVVRANGHHGSERPLRIVVIDDHVRVRSAVRRACDGHGITVVAEAADGPEGIEVALAHQPDVVLVDINLPGMSGIDVVRELAPALPHSRIVMLTVSEARRHLFASLSAGAHGYLTKDLSSEALVRAIRGAAEGDLAMPRRMAADVVRELAEPRRPPLADTRLERLSARELEVLRQLADGSTDRAIAEQLGISTRTVESHVASLLRKLQVRNRAAAAAIYRER
jgi:DNA-binding NarL/FixJ family response regulator